MESNKKVSPKTMSSVLIMLFLLLKIYKNRLITGSVLPYLWLSSCAVVHLPFNYTLRRRH